MRFRFLTTLAVIALFGLYSNSHAQRWRTISAGWKPNRITSTAEGIWAASEGGLLYVNPGSMKMDILNKDNGLFSNEISVVAVEPGNRVIWIGYPDGGLDRYDTVSGRVIQQIRDFHNDNEPEIFNIYDIVFDDSTAFIATDIGVSRMIPLENEDIWIVQETWDRLSTWEVAVICLEVSQGSIFVGTNRGVAKADLEDNLVEASNWDLFPFSQYFPDTSNTSENSINYIQDINGELYASLYGRGVYKYNGTGFSQIGNNCSSYNICTGPDAELLMAHWSGLYHLNQAQNRWERYDQVNLYNQKLFDVTYAFNKIWGTFDTEPSRSDHPGGIGAYDGNNWVLLSSNTPGGNEIYHMEIAPSGNIWVSCGLKYDGTVKMRGLYELEDGNWLDYSPLNTISQVFGYLTQSIGFDVFGGTWIGSRGNGMMRIAEDGSFQYFNAMDSTGARLIPYDNGGSFVLVGGFAPDPSGGVWFTNPENYQEKPLVFIPPEWFQDNTVEWEYFGLQENITNPYLSIIEIDEFGRLWLGSISGAGANNPVMMYDPKGTPEDKSDDTNKFFRSTDGVGFHSLLRMEYAKDGTMWFGGSDSLYYADVTVPVEDITFYPLSLPLGSRALALESDPSGNLWVGTDFGVFALSPDKQDWIEYYTSSDGQYPSPLVDDKVSALCIDPNTGELYMGTEKGISVLNTPYRNLRGLESRLTIKPQPFFVGPEQSLKLNFYGEIMQNEILGSHIKEVKIYTASGKLIKTLNRAEASLGWNGRMENNEWTPSGVYLAVVVDDTGNTEIGKLAIVRK